MLGEHVVSDLELETIGNYVQCKTTWGKKHFTEKLSSPCTTQQGIKKVQLPILALCREQQVCQQIQAKLESINTCVLDDLTDNTDTRIHESVSQILWKPDSMGAFLNTQSTVLNGLVTWKTLILPGFALLMPLLALIVPFFVLRFMNPSLESGEYLTRVRGVLLQQISVPSVLTKWKGTGNDRIGFLLESLFIGLTLAMFISSLWNQITSAIHYRSIWHDLNIRGSEIQTMIQTSKQILQMLRTLPLKKQKALRSVIESGESALESCKSVLGSQSCATYGALWNTPNLIDKLKSWISHIDVIVALACAQGICFPRVVTDGGIDVRGLYHPSVQICISNNYQSCSHSVLTGPNRGGKSTFCKSVGLAIMTAQSWGFAFASAMTFRPFTMIHTALESAGHLGQYSTFEAEIEFAKTVLASSAAEGHHFVMMDEIFHSTNASDGVAASRVFLDQLYVRSNVVSIISTHYRELAEHYGDRVTALQMLSSAKADGCLEYSYKVAPGVSSASSVMEILIERGLVAAGSPPTET